MKVANWVNILNCSTDAISPFTISIIEPSVPPLKYPNAAAITFIFQSTLEPFGIWNNLLGFDNSLSPKTIPSVCLLINVPIPAVAAVKVDSPAILAEMNAAIEGNFFDNTCIIFFVNGPVASLPAASAPSLAAFFPTTLCNFSTNILTIPITLLLSPFVPFSTTSSPTV